MRWSVGLIRPQRGITIPWQGRHRVAPAQARTLPMPSDLALYAVILAGGSGTRFWPLSRNARPKQLLALFDEETLIEKAVARLDGLIPRERILVITNAAQLAQTRATLPQLAEENVIAEPSRRDTAPAITLAAALVASRDPEAVMVVLPADQLIVDQANFRSVLRRAAFAAVNEAAIVTLGIPPDWPCPSYGYIERGERLEHLTSPGEADIYDVKCFREKPSSEVAAAYLAQGGFSWNAGIFLWTIPTLRRELASHAPALACYLDTVMAAADPMQVATEGWEGLEKISIDFALLEKAERILNLDAAVGWDDVGGWISAAKYLEHDDQNNAHRGPLLAVDSRNNVIFSTASAPLVALLGVENLIIVQTPDALLVAARDQADQIKRLVDQLPASLL